MIKTKMAEYLEYMKKFFEYTNSQSRRNINEPNHHH